MGIYLMYSIDLKKFCHHCKILMWKYLKSTVGLVVNDIIIDWRKRCHPELVKSGTMSPIAHHHCDVSSKLCCSGSKPWRWAPPLISRFGAIHNEDLICENFNKSLITSNSSDGRVVRASASRAVDLGVISSLVKPMTLRWVFPAFLLDALH